MLCAPLRRASSVLPFPFSAVDLGQSQGLKWEGKALRPASMSLQLFSLKVELMAQAEPLVHQGPRFQKFRSPFLLRTTGSNRSQNPSEKLKSQAFLFLLLGCFCYIIFLRQGQQALSVCSGGQAESPICLFWGTGRKVQHSRYTDATTNTLHDLAEPLVFNLLTYSFSSSTPTAACLPTHHLSYGPVVENSFHFLNMLCTFMPLFFAHVVSAQNARPHSYALHC